MECVSPALRNSCTPLPISVRIETQLDVIRDDMFTVLFQKNGIRYVVSALPDHEAWLTDILTTWQFH